MKKRTIDPEQKMVWVVSSARSLFVARGYHNVSIPQIVKESGVSTGAIYSYFANKAELARYIHEQTLLDFQERFEARLDGCMSTFEKLRVFAELVFEIVETDPEQMEYMMFMKHGEFLLEAYPICSTRPFRKIQAIVAEGIEKGELRQGDYLLSAVSYTGVILRAAELRLQGVLQEPLAKSADELIANAWAAIKV
ncbi:TetR/AcrR family transcriptional regulator [Trichloromonas sp.]|uniref:TetR/AcrR family transcriptional regulator n=1 Tax=Trichloromonas sp. TaxID=3069249 RepID=UPI003D813037